MSLIAIPGLSGYLQAGDAPLDARQPELASSFLQVPLMWGRDLVDVSARGDLLVQGDAIMRKRSTVPALKTGANVVGFGEVAEWRLVPMASRLTISGADHWRLYDRDGESIAAGAGSKAGLTAPRGALLLLFGDEGSRARVDR